MLCLTRALARIRYRLIPSPSLTSNVLRRLVLVLEIETLTDVDKMRCGRVVQIGGEGGKPRERIFSAEIVDSSSTGQSPRTERHANER